MATRTAYPPGSLRYRLRKIKLLRKSVRLARRIGHLPAIIPCYVSKLGPAGLRIFVASALGRKEVVVNVPGVAQPLKLRPRTSDKYCFEQIFLQDQYQLAWSHEPRLIVDAGANVGYASIFFANAYPRARVLAVEPEPSNFNALLQNVQPYPQIRPIRAAVWDRPEPVVVDNSDDAWASFVTRSESGHLDAGMATRAEGITIDDLLKSSGEESIDILKLDVEGAEKELFSAPDCTWLGKTKVLFVELHDRMVPGCSAALERALARYSFRRAHRSESTILINNEVEPDAIAVNLPSRRKYTIGQRS